MPRSNWDTHVHVGQFKERYFSPVYVSSLLRKLNVQKYVVSSTSAIFGDYHKCQSEYELLRALDGENVYPFLWINPDASFNDTEKMIESCQIKGVKIHCYANKWDLNGEKINGVFKIAEERKLPILIHTGETANCYPTDYKGLIERYKGTKIILGHGRPVNNAIIILGEFENVFVDTAFMPLIGVKAIIAAGYKSKILYGSDMPIDELYYKSSSAGRYYKKLIRWDKALSRDLSVIRSDNPQRLFQ